MMDNTHAGRDRAPDEFDPPQGIGQDPHGRYGQATPPGHGGGMQQWQAPPSNSPAKRSYYDNGPGLYGDYSARPARRATGAAAIIIFVVAITFIVGTMVAIFGAFFFIM